MKEPKYKIILWAILTLLLGHFPTDAQEEKAFRINQELWEEEAQKCTFSIEKLEKSETEKKMTRREDTFDPSSLGQSLTVFAYIFIIVILVLIVMAIIRSGGLKGNRKVKDKGEWLNKLESIEENLKDNDLDQFIKQALKDGAWDVAIRLQYLLAIQTLNKTNFIVWKKQKTNGQYLKELQGKVVGLDFKKATYIFEYVWYSNDDFTTSDLKAFYRDMESNVKAIITETQKEDKHG